MTSAAPDDELLSILLVNLRNAAATFGEGTPPYEAIRTTIEEHLQSMGAQGTKTNLTSARSNQDPSVGKTNSSQQSTNESSKTNSTTSINLPFRPKPKG